VVVVTAAEIAAVAAAVVMAAAEIAAAMIVVKSVAAADVVTSSLYKIFHGSSPLSGGCRFFMAGTRILTRPYLAAVITERVRWGMKHR
jgi:hypothetical protein